MKNLIKLMLAASAVTVGVTSCDRDTAINPADDGGEPTTVGIVFQVPSAGQPTAPDGQTRATNDGNAKEEEAAIKSADVFIYSGNGDYLSHTPLTSADFSTTNTGTATSGTTTGWDEYASTKPIATTTGQKYFLVGVNLPAGAATALQGKSMGTAATQALTVTRANINLTNGLPMFNQSGPTAATIATGATPQEVKVRVERIVSKITVERRMSPVMDQYGTPGTIGQLTWAVNNTNTRYFLQQGAAPIYADPNWTASQYVLAEFEQAQVADYVNVNDGPQTAATYNAQYAMENTSENRLQKELTRVTVRATFIPSMWVTSGTTWTAGSEPADSANSGTTPVDFWVVSPPNGGTRRVFQAAAEANTYAGQKGVTAVQHTGGICYWNFWVNVPNRQGELLRNEYYKANIISISAPGNATDAVSNDNAPVPTNTTVNAVVQIQNWSPVPMEDKNLEP